jgi:hypothetical protein
MNKPYSIMVLSHGTGRAGLFIGIIFTIIGMTLAWSLTSYAGCAVMTLAGVILITFRRGIILDAEKKTVTVRWGIFYPFVRRRRMAIHGAQGIEIVKYSARTTGGGLFINYIVNITCPERTIRLWSSTEKDDAVSIAGTASSLLKIPLIDTSSL